MPITRMCETLRRLGASGAYGVADLTVRVLPVVVSRVLARALARLAFALHVPARRVLESNLARLMETDPERAHAGQSARVTATARQAFEHFALSITDFLMLHRVSRETLRGSVEIRGAEHLEAARASGRGVIVLSAHIGSWEWGAAFLAGSVDHLHVAARPHESGAVESLFARRRRVWGVERLGGRPLWLAASRALRDREWVAIMGDRPMPERAGSLCALAAALSRRTGALVLPAAMLRLGNGRYAACFEPPLGPEACMNGGCRDAIRRFLALDPRQWFAFEPLPEGLA